MGHFRLHLFGILCGLLLMPFKAQPSAISRYRTNLGFYGGYSTSYRSVLYSNSELEDWKNLEQLAEVGGLNEKALLCGLGSGAWLAYPEANFQSSQNGSNYAMLLIGDACIPADNINSVQAIGPINKEPIGLITFTEPYFTSETVWLTNETKTSSGVKSLICPAGLAGEWTVEGSGGKVCLMRPKDMIATGVCIFPDIATQLKMDSATVTVGCPDRETGTGGEGGGENGTEGSGKQSNGILQVDTDIDGTKVILMQTCFGTFGAYKIVDNYFPLPQLKALCDDSADESHKFGFFKILDSWKFRMNPDRQKELNPADIDQKRKDDHTPLRLKLLTTFFQIFKESCPNIPEVYFNLLRYLYMQHLKSIWEEVPTTIKDKNDTRLDWKTANEFLESCLDIRRVDPVSTIPEELECIERKQYGKETHEKWEDWNDWEVPALDLFLSGDNLDHIVEQVWLMLNYVSPYCAAVKRFRNNFWVEFTNLFRRNFLMPLLQQWLHPGTWQVLYDYIFSGFNILKVKRMIISCLQDILLKIDGPDPIDRPSATVDEFTNLSKKKLPVEPSLYALKMAENPNGGAVTPAAPGKPPGAATTKAPAGTTLATKSPKKSRRKRNALKNKLNKPTHKPPSAQKLLKKEKKEKEKQHGHGGEHGGGDKHEENDKHGENKHGDNHGGNAHGDANKHAGAEKHEGEDKHAASDKPHGADKHVSTDKHEGGDKHAGADKHEGGNKHGSPNKHGGDKHDGGKKDNHNEEKSGEHSGKVGAPKKHKPKGKKRKSHGR